MNSQIPVRNLSVPLIELYPIMQEVLESGNTFTLTVRGNSMYPFLRDLRDQAIFAPINERTIRKGDIVFYQRDSGQFVMHRVYDVDVNGKMMIVGDAQWTLEHHIRPDQLRAYVIQVIRKGKTISCEKGSWRNLMTTYMNMRIDHPGITKFLYRMVIYSHKLCTDPACVVRLLKRVFGKN